MFFYCILCLCIVTVVLLLYLAIWASISLNTLQFISGKQNDKKTINKNRKKNWKKLSNTENPIKMSSEGQRYNGHFQYFPHKQCKLHRMRLLFDEIRFIYCVSCSSRGRLRPLPPCYRTNKLIYSTTEATRSVTTSFQRARNIITGGDRWASSVEFIFSYFPLCTPYLLSVWFAAIFQYRNSLSLSGSLSGIFVFSFILQNYFVVW